MADEISPLEIQDFIDAGLDRIYPGKWKRSIDIFSVIEADGIGILVIHDIKYQIINIKAGVLTGLTFSPELVRDVGELNTDIALGAYVLYKGIPDGGGLSTASNSGIIGLTHNPAAQP